MMCDFDAAADGSGMLAVLLTKQYSGRPLTPAAGTGEMLGLTRLSTGGHSSRKSPELLSVMNGFWPLLACGDTGSAGQDRHPPPEVQGRPRRERLGLGHVGAHAGLHRPGRFIFRATLSGV